MGEISLEQIFNKIISSKKDNWEIFAKDVLETPIGYERIGRYKLNLAIFLAWDFKIKEIFNQDWAKIFLDKKIFCNSLGVFYKNNLVHSVPYVNVDGFNGMLPIPTCRGNKYFVFEDDCFLIKKLSDISMQESTFDQYFERVKFKIIRERRKFNGSPS